MNWRKYRYYIALGWLLKTAVILAFVWAGPAHAQKKHSTISEKTILAFYKAAFKDPNFENLVMSLPEYKAFWGDADGAAQFLEEEKLRYEWIFANFQADKDTLEIKTTIGVALMDNAKGKALRLVFPGATEKIPPHFPYNLGEIWVTVLLNDIEKFYNIPVSDEEFSRMKTLLPEIGKAYPLKTVFNYRIAKVQSDEPVVINGTPQWMMLGDIGHIEIAGDEGLTNFNKIVWEYNAPWYLSEGEVDLLKMLNNK